MKITTLLAAALGLVTIASSTFASADVNAERIHKHYRRHHWYHSGYGIYNPGGRPYDERNPYYGPGTCGNSGYPCGPNNGGGDPHGSGGGGG